MTSRAISITPIMYVPTLALLRCFKYNSMTLRSVLVFTLLGVASSICAEPPATLTTLHRFSAFDGNKNSDGANPHASLIFGSDGNIYGTTTMGGANGFGTIFKLTPKGTLATFHAFNNADGANPYAALIEGSDGNFYGATTKGGGSGNGTVFKITPAGKLTVLHNFSPVNGNYENGDGITPFASLIEGSDGNFYGTTYEGGIYGYGTVFKITPVGALTNLHSFNIADGANPYAALIQANDGNFYGTTDSAQTGAGTIFKITPAGKLSTLYTFGSGSGDGSQPLSALKQGQDGSFYGTTEYGGQDNDGTVFKFTPGAEPTILHMFDDLDGLMPDAALIQGSDSSFYGTTYIGGNDESGTIFKITPDGFLTILYTCLSPSQDGRYPYAALIQSHDGDFYGTTTYGGDSGNGTIFKLTTTEPTIASPPSASAIVGKPFSYQIIASSSPTSYGVGGLFKGITVDQKTGLISGTLATVGKHTLTLRATNGFGTDTAPLTLTVEDMPAITSATTATAQVGMAFSYQITATGNPTSYGVGGLRPGLSVDSKTGKITGTPTGAGRFTLTLRATNAAGTGEASLTLTIKPSAPVITSPGAASATAGMPFSYQIIATSSPTYYGAGGLFGNLTCDSETGVISGTPTGAGTHTLDLRAQNAGGTGHKTLTLTVAAQ